MNKNDDKQYMNPLPTSLPLNVEVKYYDELLVDDIEEVHENSTNHTEGRTFVTQSDGSNEKEEGGHETAYQELRKSTILHKHPAWMSDFLTSKTHKAMSATTVVSQQVNPDF